MNNYKDFYLNTLPTVLSLSAQCKIPLDNAYARYSYSITVNRCIENHCSTNQYYNIILLIFRY
ncbi:hypothetical protein [Salmonella phage SD-1_S14]|nr:hypothetical protein [Salmonella phage SD-2_S15]WPK19171.1 hypothetical protein [Salmonella phage SD-6_S16]WPK19840.1 hypothetical protein [Salmonella phage SD-1_S14]WPK20867.1 hypothetical protein [Salmonella phage SD-15_S21]